MYFAKNDSRVRSVSREEIFAHEILMQMRMKWVYSRSSLSEKRTICQFYSDCVGHVRLCVFLFLFLKREKTESI